MYTPRIEVVFSQSLYKGVFEFKSPLLCVLWSNMKEFINETKSTNVYEKETSFVKPIGNIDCCNVYHAGVAMFMTIPMILVQTLIVSHR